MQWYTAEAPASPLIRASLMPDTLHQQSFQVNNFEPVTLF
jgi:hypothetical protein